MAKTKQIELPKKVLREPLRLKKEKFESEGWKIYQLSSTGQWFGEKDKTQLHFEKIEKLYTEIEKANQSKRKFVEVDAKRLNSGDIYKSNSLMSIMEGKIKTPFEFEGSHYVWTGAVSGGAGHGWSEVDAYKVVPLAEFRGETRTYGERFSLPDSHPDRYGYNKIRVTYKKEEFVLVGPKVTFVPKKDNPLAGYYPQEVVDKSKKLPFATKEVFAKKGEYEANGWLFEYNPEKDQWSAEKQFGEDIEGFSNVNGLDRILGFCEKLELKYQKAEAKPVSPKQEYHEISVYQISPSESEPQKERQLEFTEENIAEMANSIRAEGVIQPILVRPLADGFELVAGERRWRGAMAAGLEKIPAVIRNLTDEKVIKLQLHENLKRHGIHPLQEAFTYDYMSRKQGKSLEEIADEAGKKIGYIAQRKRLVHLSDKVKDFFRRNDITVSHALEIAKFPIKDQDEVLELAFNSFGYTTQALYPMSRFTENIQKFFLLRLDKAPFSLTSKDLGNVPCVECGYRTSAQPLLFTQQSANDDSCTFRGCWNNKVVKNEKLEKEKAEAKASKTAKKSVKDLIEPKTESSNQKDEKSTQLKTPEEKTENDRIILKNKNSKFDKEIFEAVRLRVAKKAVAKVDDSVPGTDAPAFRRIVARMWELQCESDEDVTERICEWLGLDTDIFPYDYGATFADVFEHISNLSGNLVRKLWFLLIFETYQTQNDVMDLADEKGIDYIILDAEERLAQAPMDRKDEYRYYLHQLESGNKNAVMPKRYL
jgi:ParB/RepB/Spo0J family partition protein